MVSTLFIFQLVSFIAYLVLAMMLAICPYEGEEFQNYNRVRRLYIIAMIIMAVQFLTQLIFGFRENNATLGAAVNMIELPFADMFFTMGIFSMTKPTKTLKRHWNHFIGYTCVNATVLTALTFIYCGQPELKYAVWGSIAWYMIAFSIVFGILVKELNRLNKNAEENHVFPIEKSMEWIKRYLYLRMAVTILMPCLAIDSKATVVFSITFYVGIAYFITKFIYFGYFFKTFDIVAKDTEEEEAMFDEIPENSLLINEDDPMCDEIKMIAPMIDEWEANEGFRNNKVTLTNLAKELGLSRRQLSIFFNVTKNMTFREWITELRIAKAKALIRVEPPLSNESIAAECGFSSRTYFQTSFRNQEGVTPGEWREKYTKKEGEESQQLDE